MSPLETRHSLIVRLQNPQNELAWQDFVCSYESFLEQLIRRQGVPQRHVADVQQQILMAIVKSIDGWKDDGSAASFRRWLSTVARNVTIRFMTRERRHAAAVGGTEWISILQGVEHEPAESALENYQHELIVWAAQQVRHEFLETSWKAFWGTVVGGRPVEQVARELGLTSGAIYMSRSRIMARIRKTLALTLEDA